MAIPFSATWGPYAGPLQARNCLTGFVDAVCGQDLGVAWASGDAVWPLRAPKADPAGFGQVAVFEWHPAPPPRQIVKPRDLFDRLKDTVEGALAQIGKQQLAQAEAGLAMSQTLAQAIGGIRMQHKADAAGVALDVICVALSIGALATGVGFIGVVALTGGIILLGTDGTAYTVELAGKDGLAETIKKRTEVIRMIATVMTLPDAAWGGLKAIREFQEIRELRTGSQATAAIAANLGKGTANAARASEYAQILEQAQLKAQIRSEQLRGLFLHELTPRATVPASLYLLLREELDNDNHSILASFLQRLTFHVVAVHK